MFIDINELMTIIFELTLFGIFVYYLGGIIKQHIAPALREQIKEQIKYWKSLWAKKEKQRRKYHDLERAIVEQKEKLISLESKMKKWHKGLQKQHAEKLQQQETIKEKIIQKKKLQMKNATLQLLEKKVLPQAFIKTRKNLQEEFSHERGKLQLSELIKSLSGTQGEQS